jgi:hypothetical protein
MRRMRKRTMMTRGTTKFRVVFLRRRHGLQFVREGAHVEAGRCSRVQPAQA